MRIAVEMDFINSFQNKMFNIIPLILILLSLTTIIIIVAKKFSVLANLDVNTIQSEREAKFKERIIGNRLKRNYFKYYSRILRIINPIISSIGKYSKISYKKLIEFKDSYGKKNILSNTNKESIKEMIVDAEKMANNNFEEAEKKYIEIIGIDSGNIDAFKSLGKFYYNNKKYNEAKQTQEHALKLLEKKYNLISGRQDNNLDEEEHIKKKNELEMNIASVYYDLSLINCSLENNILALETINKALKIEQNNPRYLDIKFKISIICKDKILANEAYEAMKKVNSDNQNLSDFEKQLNELE